MELSDQCNELLKQTKKQYYSQYYAINREKILAKQFGYREQAKINKNSTKKIDMAEFNECFKHLLK